MGKAVCGWKLLYSSCSGEEGRALEYLTGEIGKYILRDPGVYAVFTLPCEKVTSDSLPDCDAIVLGTLAENPLLQRFIRAEEIPAKGSLVRIVSNPEQTGKQLILIAGSDPVNVLYGAIDLMERIVPESAPSPAIICIIRTVFSAFLFRSGILPMRRRPMRSGASSPGDIRSMTTGSTCGILPG